jgi:hypothetical protein
MAAHSCQGNVNFALAHARVNGPPLYSFRFEMGYLMSFIRAINGETTMQILL